MLRPFYPIRVSAGKAENLASLTATLSTATITMQDLEEMVKRDSLSRERREQNLVRLEGLRKDFQEARRLYNQHREAARVMTRSVESSPLISETTPLSSSYAQQRESVSLTHSSNRIDEYIAMGMSVKEQLSRQRMTLKGTQRRLLDALQGIGVSGGLLRIIRRRSGQDRWIFWAGVIVTALLVYYLYRLR